MPKRRKPRNFKLFEQYRYFAPGVPSLIILMVWFLIGALLGMVVSNVITILVGDKISLEYIMLITYPMMFLPPMLYASYKSMLASGFDKEEYPLDRSSFAPLGAVKVIAAAVIAIAAAGVVSDGVSYLLPKMPEALKTLLEAATSGKLWVNLICVSVFAPFFEEWLCRGMILRGLLAHKVKPVWAILISALVFALIHANPWQAVPALILGSLIGYVYYKTGSLKIAMLMHCVNNTIAVVLGNIDSLKEFDSFVDYLGVAKYCVFAFACLVIVVWAVKEISKINSEQC